MQNQTNMNDEKLQDLLKQIRNYYPDREERMEQFYIKQKELRGDSNYRYKQLRNERISLRKATIAQIESNSSLEL